MQTLEASKTIQTPPVVKDPGIRLVPAGGGGWGRKKEAATSAVLGVCEPSTYI